MKKIFLLGILLSFFSLKSMATVVYVDSAHVGGVQNGTSWATAYSSVGSAIVSTFTDSIWVAKGTYQTGIPQARVFGGFLNTDTSLAQRNWQSNTTRFKAPYTFASSAVWIDGVTLMGDTAFYFTGITNSGNVSSRITNCTFTNCRRAIYIDGGNSSITNCTFLNNKIDFDDGAGIYILSGSPLITNCIFTNNVITGWGDGAAIFNDGGSPVIKYCTFTNNESGNGAITSLEDIEVRSCIFTGNHARAGGGAMVVNGGAQIIDSCIFNNNTADWAGGAIYSNGPNLTVSNCSFTDNSVSSSEYCYGGALAMMWDYSNIVNCTFTNNKAIGGITGNGGALFSGNTTITRDCIFTGNKASGDGGAIIAHQFLKAYNCHFSADSAKRGSAIALKNTSPAKVMNCLFDRNVADSIGGALFIDTAATYPQIVNCTFVKNKAMANAAAIYNVSNKTPLLRNAIIWSNSGGMYNGAATPVNIAYSLIQGLSANNTTHLLDGTINPLFIDTAGTGNFRLQPLSPCINKGNKDSIPSDIATDLVNHPRIYGDTVDLGAYEYIYAPVVNLGNDTAICAGSILSLDAENAGAHFLWSNGDTTRSISVTSEGIYFVTVSNVLGEMNDTILVAVSPLPVVNLGNDTTISGGNFVMLNAGNAGSDYLWSTGATTQTITINSGGNYSVTVTDAEGCSASDAIRINVNPLGTGSVEHFQKEMTISPNPAKEVIHISSTDENLLHTKAVLTDIYGRTVREIMLNSKLQQLSMAGLASGVYILNTITGSSVKIVKQ